MNSAQRIDVFIRWIAVSEQRISRLRGGRVTAILLLQRISCMLLAAQPCDE
jgi:hypothetical protein